MPAHLDSTSVDHRPVIFIRGFNSYPSDELQFGPINLGLVHRHLQPEFEARGFHFIPLYKMGFGPIERQIERARDQVLALRLNPELHLLGHSTGGVIARGLAHALKSTRRILSVTTIVSPHRGSTLANRAAEFERAHPLWYKLWKAAGYDVKLRVPLLEPLKSKSMAQFNEQYPDLPGVSYSSIVSGAPLKSLPLFMRMIGQFADDTSAESDGIVEKSSQPWGDVLGEFSADHNAIIGFRTMASPIAYRRARAEFTEAVRRIHQFYAKVEI